MAAIAGDAADVVREAKAGLICPPEDPEALARTALEFFKMDESERRRLGNNGVKAAHARFSKEKIISQIEAVMISLVEGKQ